MKNKVFSLVLVMMLVALSLVGCGSAKSNGTLVVGTNAAFPPFEYIGDDGNPDGFEQGKHYTYTLIFGVGYDEGGRANVIHLDMSSTITDWNREIINFDKNVL